MSEAERQQQRRMACQAMATIAAFPSLTENGLESSSLSKPGMKSPRREAGVWFILLRTQP